MYGGFSADDDGFFGALLLPPPKLKNASPCWGGVFTTTASAMMKATATIESNPTTSQTDLFFVGNCQLI
jgi:hypothetical protein